jgi:hypothetical protein
LNGKPLPKVQSDKLRQILTIKMGEDDEIPLADPGFPEDSPAAWRQYAIANQGGHARNGIENVFNVEKNGGFGLEHAFYANTVASQNYHIMMQAAYIIWQLLAKGLSRRLLHACRKITVLKMVDLLRVSLYSVRINPLVSSFGQLRFLSSA